MNLKGTHVQTTLAIQHNNGTSPFIVDLPIIHDDVEQQCESLPEGISIYRPGPIIVVCILPLSITIQGCSVSQTPSITTHNKKQDMPIWPEQNRSYKV